MNEKPETKPSVDDPEISLIMLYHPENKGEGTRWYTDELPKGVKMDELGDYNGGGWYHSPTAFPGYKAPEVRALRRGSDIRVDPTQTCLYHKVHGARPFWTNEMPSDPGWFDTPTAAAEWDGEVTEVTDLYPDAPAAPAIELDAELSEELNDWMIAYLADYRLTNMPEDEKERLKCEGVRSYARVKYNAKIDGRMNLKNTLSELKKYEASAA